MHAIKYTEFCMLQWIFINHTSDLSEQLSSLSCRRKELPWASRESLSISPNRIPPALLRPFTGWWVRISIGPVVLTWSDCIHKSHDRNTKMNLRDLPSSHHNFFFSVSLNKLCIPGTYLRPCVSVFGSRQHQRKCPPQIPFHSLHYTFSHCQNSYSQLRTHRRLNIRIFTKLHIESPYL